MKKKLLSLVLAGAMVASTSVSAFAATTDKEYTIGEKGQEHQVTITGDVANGSNETVPGTITVTVPTTMKFMVSSTGELQGGNITVVNRSTDKVEVVAQKFTDTTSDGKIVVVKDSELNRKIKEGKDDTTKRYVSLRLTGNGKSVNLVSNTTDSSTGFVDEAGSAVTAGTNTSLGNAWENNDLVLRLEGRAKSTESGESYTAPTDAMNDQFNLVLKIQKAR